MAIPTKKIYGRNGKLIFDPNNPEDVKNYREKQPLMEAFNLVRGLTDPRGGGGLFGMARKATSKVVSKAVAKETVKKAAKSTTKRSSKKVTTTENKVEKPNLTLENLKKALNPSSGLPGSLPKVGNNKSLSASNKSLTSNTPKSRTVQKTLPAGEESKSVIKTAPPRVRTLSDFMKQQSEVITPLLPDVKTLPSGSTKLPKINNVLEQQAKVNATRKTVNNTTRNVEVPKTSNNVPFPSMKDVLNKQLNPSNPFGLKLLFEDAVGRFKIGDSKIAASQVSKEIPTTIPNATKKIKSSDNLFKNRYGKEEFKKIYSDFDKFKLNDDVINNSFLKGLSIAGASGVGAGTVYFSMKNKSDVKLDETKLKDSTKYKGVKIIKVDGKDKGIIKDNKTGKWRYFNEDKDGELLPQKIKPQERKVTGGGYTPIDKTKKDNEVKNQEKSGLAIGGGDGGGGSKSPNTGGGSGSSNNQKTITGSGTTTPRSKTGQAFDKAFAEARKQAGGAGGIFEWNGKKYGTALEGETVPKNRVEVGKTTTPVTIKNDYPTTKTDPTLEMAMEQDSIRQQMATKPLSSLVFKPTSKAVDVRNVMDEQDALRSIRADNKLPLKKKKYGGNLAMLKYMK
jgi:hypothetical protein